jgi:hypothetical protein
MAKLEVTKTIEARMLNKRNRQVLSQPPVTIPYGAILDDVVENRDMIEFNYVGELYSCKAEVLRAASHSLDGPPVASQSSTSSGVASAPAPAIVEATFVWEKLNSGSLPVSRAKLPGGWLIVTGDGAARSIAFYPDAAHAWDGKTLAL